jgi:hypothetical protein
MLLADYHSLKDNHNLEDEKQLSGKDKEITVPLLYVGQVSRDQAAAS